MILKPIRLAHIKPSIICNRHRRIKVCGTLELLLKPRILFELGKQGSELFLAYGLMAAPPLC